MLFFLLVKQMPRKTQAQQQQQDEDYNFGNIEVDSDEEVEEQPKKETKPKQQKKAPKRVESSDSDEEPEAKPSNKVEEQPKKETKQKRAKKETKPKQPKTETQKQTFNLKSMIRFLNSCYDEFNFKDIDPKKEEKKTSFKIDLTQYKAIEEFKKVLGEYEKEEQEKDTKAKESEKWNEITKSIFDFKLRGIMTLFNDFKLMKKDEATKENDTRLFMDYIIPQLHFNEPEDFEVSQVRDNMAEFLTSDRIKFKLYNNMFPHPTIPPKEGKTESRLNKVYLQNISKYHDKYLEMLYSGSVSSADELYEYACEQIAYRSTVGTTKDRLLNLSFDGKHKLTKEERKFESDERLARQEHHIAQRYYKCYAEAIVQELITKKEATKRYNEYMEKVQEYRDHAKDIMKDKTTKLNKFIDLFVSEFKTLNEDLKYNNSVKNYIHDIHAENILTFTPQFKQILTKIINGEKIELTFTQNKRFIAKIMRKDAKTGKQKEKEVNELVIRERRHTFENMRDTLAKIGLIAGDNINKNVRIAIGVSIVDYIYTEARRITERSKLPKKSIYLKF